MPPYAGWEATVNRSRRSPKYPGGASPVRLTAREASLVLSNWGEDSPAFNDHITHAVGISELLPRTKARLVLLAWKGVGRTTTGLLASIIEVE